MRISRAVFVLALAVFVPLDASSAVADGIREARTEGRRLMREATAAARKGDDAVFLAKMKEAAAVLPNDPGVLYNLACAESKAGDLAGAAAHLVDSLSRGADYGVAEDDDLAAVRKSPEYAPVRAKLEELGRPVGAATLAFSLPERDLITEGIAFDPKTKAFFVSSVRRRKIVRRSADGTLSDFVPSGRDNLPSVLALRADPARRLLWATVAATTAMAGRTAAEIGRTGLVAFDIESGKTVRSVFLPPGEAGKERVLGDLEISPGGDVFTTDGASGGIYRLRAGSASFDVVSEPGVFPSPQGLVLARDGRRLLVADYAEGLFSLPVDGGARTEIPGPPKALLSGIDGLVRRGKDLVAIQNAFRPNRVVRLRLDDGETRVTALEVLERNDRRVADPTLGVIVGNDLFHVANSQWGSVNEKGEQVAAEKLQEPMILRLPLP